MIDEENGNVIVFNGEIYNHNEIRERLKKTGVASFSGGSDTETLLKAYRIWGTDIVRHLEGMFAIAIYEAKSHSIVLIRDRFGIKPLYLKFTRDGFSFSSEARTLLAGESLLMSGKSLASYLHWGVCSHESLLFESIQEFPTGSWQKIALDGSGFPGTKPVSYWPPPKRIGVAGAHKIPISRGEALATTRALLENSVSKHLMSDVPVACFLSGGIDSSVLVALTSKLLNKNNPGGKPATFSVGFSETGFDESVFARQVAQMYGTDHHHIQLNEEEKLRLVEEAVEVMDLPSYDAINTYIVSKKVAEAGYKVVLSGLGADEVFGGYPIFRDYWRVMLFASLPRVVRNLASLTGRGLRMLCDVPEEKNGETLSRWIRRCWTGPMLSNAGLEAPVIRSTHSPVVPDAMGELSWGEVSCYIRDVLLRDADAMSMAHSLEIRVPFLDNKLVDFLFQLPASLKFDPLRPKSLLLDAMLDLLPEQIWNRPKMGFSLPMKEWMCGPLESYCREGIESLKATQLMKEESLDEAWKDFIDDRVPWNAIWAIVVLGKYLNKNSQPTNSICSSV